MKHKGRTAGSNSDLSIEIIEVVEKTVAQTKPAIYLL